MSSSMMAVKDLNHLQEVLDMAKGQSKLLVLEFMGSVNSACEFMRPIMEDKIVPAFKNRAYFYTLDVNDKNFKDLKKRWKVEALPDFVMVKNDARVNRLVTTDKDELMAAITNGLDI
ncbi:hypothetical protein HU200_019962 [Digitaria exilis]|uniref:Thioredoxin domain-containing protein n=1 Tax=Digitaria exilis TaxID=1010633 RepID=A0A835F156_9POAL|nr:hypothetical protein HU200_019962 [Digitaria exilis]